MGVRSWSLKLSILSRMGVVSFGKGRSGWFWCWVHGFECWVAGILQVWQRHGRGCGRPLGVGSPRGMLGEGMGLVRRARKSWRWQEEAVEVSDRGGEWRSR